MNFKILSAIIGLKIEAERRKHRMGMIIVSALEFALSAFNVAIFVHAPTNYLNIAAAVWLFGLGIITTKLIKK